MTRALMLEEFGVEEFDLPPMGPLSNTAELSAPAEASSTQPVDPETGLDAFEQGYRSGWDDCIANETDERRRVGADLSVALSEISLSAEAIRQELLGAIGPVLEGIATHLLPVMAAEAVAPFVVEEVRGILLSHGPVTLEVLATPEKCAAIEHLLQTATELPVSVVAEPAYAEGQVSIRFADQQRDIDLTDAAARMADLIRAFAAPTRPLADAGLGPVDQPEQGVA